jgi:hypothetical protein
MTSWCVDDLHDGPQPGLADSRSVPIQLRGKHCSIRQKGSVQDQTFEMGFLDAGAQVFAFTFG